MILKSVQIAYFSWFTKNYIVFIKAFVKCRTEGVPLSLAIVHTSPDNLTMGHTYMTHSQMLGKFEYTGGPIFKVVLEC